MSLAENQTRQSTIDWIEQGKTWSGKDGTEMQEYKVSLKNGDIEVIRCLDCGFWHQWPIP